MQFKKLTLYQVPKPTSYVALLQCIYCTGLEHNYHKKYGSWGKCFEQANLQYADILLNF